MVMFGTTDGGYFPAELALAGQYNLLVDGNGAVFTEQNHTINLRIEVQGLFGILELSLIKILHPVAGVQRMGSTGGYHVS